MIRCLVLRVATGALIAVLLCGGAGAQQPRQPDLVVPDDPALAIMIKTALIAFNHANATGNYTVLRDLASPSFQQANTPARLAEIFKKQRDRKIDISPIVLLQPQLPSKPWIDENRLLRLVGFFASRPEQVNFTLAYQAVDGRWRLFAIGVTTERVQETANESRLGRPVRRNADGGNQPDPLRADPAPDDAESSSFRARPKIMLSDFSGL